MAHKGSLIRIYDDVLRLRRTYRYEMRYLLELGRFSGARGVCGFLRSAPRYGAEQVWVAEAVLHSVSYSLLQAKLRANRS